MPGGVWSIGMKFPASAPISTGVNEERVSPSKSVVRVDADVPTPSIGVEATVEICRSGIAAVGAKNCGSPETELSS